MVLNKKVTTLAAAFALVFAASPASAAKKSAPTAQDAITKIDGAVKAMQSKLKGKANKLLAEAQTMLEALPQDEETSEAKGYYYQAKAEMELFINNSLEGFEENKALCEKASKNYGAQINYLAGGFYFDLAMALGKPVKIDIKNPQLRKSNSQQMIESFNKSHSAFMKAFEFDPELKLLNNDDINKFMNLCKFTSNFSDMAKFFDKFFASKNTSYFANIGSNATSIYEMAKKDDANNIPKAVLISILDFEAIENADGNALAAILEKNFSKYNEAASSIAFVKKFYSDENFTKADLNSLPAGVRDFLPVRYMYKMKTSNDVEALKNEFGTFFSNAKKFQARLAAKK